MAKVDQYLYLQARNFARFPLALCRSSYGPQTDCRLSPTDRQPISPLEKKREGGYTHLHCGIQSIYAVMKSFQGGLQAKYYPWKHTFIL